MNRDRSFGAERRIKRRQDFLRIQQSGEKVGSKHFLLAYCKKPRDENQGSLSDSRLGLTITTKVDKRAARRNRLKRRIREVFRLSRQFFAEHADVVVIARQGATELPYRSMQRELRHLLIRAGIISADNRGPERGARNRQRRPR